MNRQIIFRGKLKSGNGWAYGNLAVNKSGHAIITPDDTPIGTYGAVQAETVGQYTGLKDRNGVRVFEGDIVRVKNAHEDDPTVGKVIYDDLNACYLIYDGLDSEEFSCDIQYVSYEVLGNIHDNSELLQEETE
jgi:uncharacterized phage protein (TIGR01671 family)